MLRPFRRPIALVMCALLAISVARAATLSPRVFLPLALKAPPAANDLLVDTATFLGGSAADSVSAVDISPSGEVIVAGTFPVYAPEGITPVVLAGGGSGALLRLNSTGGKVLGVSRLGAKINDLEIGASGAIVVCGDFGVAQLTAGASEVLWQSNPGEGKRCAVGSDGTVAMLANNNIYTYDARGNDLHVWPVGGSGQADIAVDGASETVIAAGYTQKDVAGACSGTLKSPYVRAWDYMGETRWKNYDWSAEQANSAAQCADSEMLRTSIGRDGKLYLAGTTDGGNTVFARDPKNIDLALGSRQVKTDKYNDPYGLSGAIKFTWYGRYSPITGQLELGQFLLTRNDGKNNQGNSIDPRAITAATDGTMYVVGSAYYRMANRDAQSIAGTLVGDYEGGEAYLLVVSADMKTRLHWTPFAGPKPNKGGGSPANAIAVRGQTAALGISFNPGSGGRNLIINQALQPQPAGNTEGYVVVWQP